MHVHVPKPLHGWRAFIGEVGIIVLGVLIALGVEQLVQAAHERQLAHEAQEAINQELQTDLDRIAYRQRQQSCVLKRLDEIQALLTRWRGDDAFPAGLHVGFPGAVGMVDQRWQANLASGRFSQEPADQQADQTSIYTLVHVVGSVEGREIESWSQLRALEFGSQALSTASKPMIAQALANARDNADALGGLMAALVAGLRTAGPGRPAMIPSRDYAVAHAGSTCQPMRPGGIPRG